MRWLVLWLARSKASSALACESRGGLLTARWHAAVSRVFEPCRWQRVPATDEVRMRRTGTKHEARGKGARFAATRHTRPGARLAASIRNRAMMRHGQAANLAALVAQRHRSQHWHTRSQAAIWRLCFWAGSANQGSSKGCPLASGAAGIWQVMLAACRERSEAKAVA